MAIKQEIIDELLKDYKSPEDLLGDDGEMSITVPRDRDASVVLTALMTRLFPCMPVVCLSVRYAVIWRSYTA
jgi:hypothetical protein